MKSILDSQDLQTRLHRLYHSRQLLEFTQGTAWFDQQAIDIWTEWLKYEPKFVSKPDSIQAQLDVFATPEFNKACWELDHGYLKEEVAS